MQAKGDFTMKFEQLNKQTQEIVALIQYGSYSFPMPFIGLDGDIQESILELEKRGGDFDRAFEYVEEHW